MDNQTGMTLVTEVANRIKECGGSRELAQRVVDLIMSEVDSDVSEYSDKFKDVPDQFSKMNMVRVRHAITDNSGNNLISISGTLGRHTALPIPLIDKEVRDLGIYETLYVLNISTPSKDKSTFLINNTGNLPDIKRYIRLYGLVKTLTLIARLTYVREIKPEDVDIGYKFTDTEMLCITKASSLACYPTLSSSVAGVRLNRNHLKSIRMRKSA